MPPGHEREINIWGIFINTGQINVNKQQPYRIRRPLHKGWHRADSRMLSMAHGRRMRARLDRPHLSMHTLLDYCCAEACRNSPLVHP
jgi:hypothetical protein